jgi:uncharacterized repeat protein (TIGR01451 family)
MLSKRMWWSAGACCALAAGFVGQHVRGQGTPPPLPDLPPIVTSPSSAPSLTPPIGTAPNPLPPIATPSPGPGSSPMPPALFPMQESIPPIVNTPSVSNKIAPPAPPIVNAPETTLPIQPSIPPINNAPSLELTPKAEPKDNIVLLPEQGPNAPIPADPNGGLDLGPAIDAKPGKQEPTVSIEWVAPQNARLNHPLPCQILVKNNGTVGVQNVVVRHNLLPGVTLKASEPAARQDKQALTWDIGTIPAGSFRKIDLTIVSTLRGNLNFPATVSFAASTSQVVQFREPLLQIQARAQEKALQGEPVVVAFAVSNPGDGMTENVKVRAMLPEGLDHPRGRSLELDVGHLAPKESKTVQVQCMARGSGAQHVTLVAMADGNLAAQAKAHTEIILPRLDVAVAGPKLRYVERPAQYVAKVGNPGTAPAAGVVVTQAVPVGFKFHNATAGGRFDEAARQVVWTVGDLMPGQSREMAVELIPTTAGEFHLPIQAVSARGVKNEQDVRTRVEGLSSLVMEVADTDDPVEVNGETAYEIRVLNAGTKVETNIELVCTLPDQADLKDARCIAGLKHRVEGRTVIFEPAARLAPRADLIFRVVVRGKLPGDGRFRAQVRAEGMTEAVSRDETTRFYRDDLLPR